MDKQICIEPTVYRQLIAVSRWYDQYPKDCPLFDSGNRFHDNVADFQFECLPATAVPDGWYVQYFEFRKKEFYAIVVNEEDEDDQVAYKLVAMD